MHIVLRLGIFVVAATLLVAGLAWHGARQMPIVRRATVEVRDWPAGTPPMTVVVIADIHIGNSNMDADRLSRIVDRINALRPDLVLIAGDLVAGHAPGTSAALAPALTAPLARLTPRLGVAAVLGNHDHGTGAAAVQTALTRAGVVLLDNRARRFGALTVAGIGDSFTGHANIAAAMTAARALGGPRIVFTHGPDVVPDLPADAPLVAVGHMHCGQIVLPFWGAPVTPSRYGRRYLCGIVREAGRTTFVTAGLGTSVVPFRIGAPPDLWLLTLR